MEVLLIPVFIVFLLLLPVLTIALLLCHVPVRAAVTLVHTTGHQEQVVVISWGILALRTSGSGAMRVTDLLILDHTILSHTFRAETVSEKSLGDILPEQMPGPAGALNMDELVPIARRIAGPIGTFGSEFWHRSRFVDARGTITIGLGDPALTGEVYGYYWASRFILEASRIWIEMEPVFDRAVLELDITVRVKVERPLFVMIAGLNLARDPALKDMIAYTKQRDTGAAAA